MAAIRRRLPYFCALLLLCAAGLYVRSRNAVSPSFFTAYFPDVAWTMAVYCGFGLLFCQDARFHFFASLTVSVLIELSQLMHTPFLDAMRSTTLGGLILGYGFLWSDLVCYAVGACLCAAVQTGVLRAIGNRPCNSRDNTI